MAVAIGVLLFRTPNEPAAEVPTPVPALEGIRYGALTLELTPADSQVTLPDIETPYRAGMRLPEGPHRVMVRREGYAETSRTVSVVGDTRVRIELSPAKQKDHARAHDDVRSPLEALEGEKRTDRIGDLEFAMLDNDESAHFHFELPNNASYMVVASCDSDCQNVDLRLYDAYGNDSASETVVEGRSAMVAVLPGERSTTLHAEIRISTCEIEPCHIGVGVFGDPDDLDSSATGKRSVDQHLISDIHDRWNAFENQLGADYQGLDDDPEFGVLNMGQSDYHRVKLSDATSYKLAALCDRNCSDIDLVLLDEHRQIVAEDAATNSVPTIDMTPSIPGIYHLEVRMYSCEKEPCLYSVMVWQR